MLVGVQVAVGMDVEVTVVDVGVLVNQIDGEQEVEVAEYPVGRPLCEDSVILAEHCHPVGNLIGDVQVVSGGNQGLAGGA